MIRVADLSGAQLDYWTARAEGIPAEQLWLYHAPYSRELVCAREWDTESALGRRAVSLRYSTDWAQGGPLIEKHRMYVDHVGDWRAAIGAMNSLDRGAGDTPLQAICRAVVRAAFGDEVEEVAVCK